MKIYISISNGQIETYWRLLGVDDCHVTENRDAIHVSSIKIDKEKRDKGIGTKAMEYLIEYADKTNKIITLSPSTDYGATSKSRLVSFYRRFGFKPNKGRYADYKYSDSMIRRPLSKLVGYKIMSYVNGKIISLAKPDIVIPKRIGSTISAVGNGVYLSPSKAFVIRHYSGLTDFDDVLLELEYNKQDVITGDPDYKEGELSVSRATIKNIEIIKNEN